MKSFADLKQGDTVYFLIDTCGILKEYGDNSVGFANSNYGLIICQRTISSEWWLWHKPRTEKGLLFELRVDKPIMHRDKCLFGPYINEYGNKSEFFFSITKEMGKESCLRQSFGDYFCSYAGYIFTTKEELEAKIRNTTDAVETNLKRIYDDLNTLN